MLRRSNTQKRKHTCVLHFSQSGSRLLEYTTEEFFSFAVSTILANLKHFKRINATKPSCRVQCPPCLHDFKPQSAKDKHFSRDFKSFKKKALWVPQTLLFVTGTKVLLVHHAPLHSSTFFYRRKCLYYLSGPPQLTCLILD